MLYSEFLEGTGVPETMMSFTVYSGLNRIYMRHDDYTKAEVYKDGARIVEDLDIVSRPRRIVPKNAYYHGLNKPLTYSCSHCLFHADEDDCFCRACGAEFIPGGDNEQAIYADSDKGQEKREVCSARPLFHFRE